MSGFLLIPSAVGFLLIAYFAVSSRSSPLVRRVAIITLAVLCLAVLICLLLILTPPAEKPESSLPRIPQEAASGRQAEIDWIALFMVVLFLLGVIIVAILRNRRGASRPGGPPPPPQAQDNWEPLPAERCQSQPEEDGDPEGPAKDRSD